MCGRYFYSPSDMRRELPGIILKTGAEAWTETEEPRDIYPGSVAPVLIDEKSALALAQMRWGFQNSGNLVINARSETIDQKPMFKALSVNQRCAVPASKYYEWRRTDRQKYSIALKDRGLFFMAGLFRHGAQGREFVILTQSPVPAVSRIHDRMPLLLDSRDALRRWLGGATPLFKANDALNVSADGPEQLQMSFV